MSDLAATKLREHFSAFLNILESKGYNHIGIHSLDVSNADLLLYYRAEDDFQEKASRELRVHSGFMESCRADTIQELYNKLQALPSREQRELRFLAQRLAGLAEAEEKLVSLAGKEFVAGLTVRLEDLRRQIEDRSAELPR